MTPEHKQAILALPYNQSIYISGYFSVVLAEVKALESETYKRYNIAMENQGIESGARITNKTKAPKQLKEHAPSLRSTVITALQKLSENNPVTIPLGFQAAQYAYAHARERGLRYKITPGGIVSLAPKQEETRKIDLLKRLINLEKGEVITETVTQAYLRKVEDVSGYGFLLNDGAVTRLK